MRGARFGSFAKQRVVPLSHRKSEQTTRNGETVVATRKAIESVPSPKRLIEALRDVGYDFSGAVADIVDNSIAANATRVDIQVHWDGSDSWVRIADNGWGMDGSTISEALRFGSERTYRQDDLGKFGLGLKTASLSQCRVITVASRTSANRRNIEARRFDLDHLIRVNRWEIEDLPSAQRDAELVEPLKDKPGTVVLWTQLDRILSYRIPHGDHAKKALWTMVEALELHLGMVFHRFLEGDLGGVRRQRLTITLNGNKIAPWNPFAVNESATRHLQAHDFTIAEKGVSGIVSFDPAVLPARDRFSSEAEFNRLSGPQRWNQQQGFYIYRANRMIQSGGWSRTRTADEHTKLARASLDFFPELDEAFGLNIAKMRVNLPSQLREGLKGPVEALIRESKKSYNAKTSQKGTAADSTSTVTKQVKPSAKPALPAPFDGSAQGGGVTLPVDNPAIAWPPPPLQRKAKAALEEAAAEIGQSEALTLIVKQLEKTDKEISRALGWE